jgi:hypothetical protein
VKKLGCPFSRCSRLTRSQEFFRKLILESGDLRRLLEKCVLFSQVVSFKYTYPRGSVGTSEITPKCKREDDFKL